MRSLSLACPLAVAATGALAASSTPCVLQGASIGKFDLRGLRNKKQDYVATNPDGGAISLNFCGAVSDQASPAEAAQGYGAYIEDTRGGISLGEYSTTPAYHNGQLSLTYKNGAACPNSNARRSSLIYLQCDQSWTSGNKLNLIDSVDDCVYFFTMKTPYACSQSGGFFSAIWGAIVFLFWIGVVVGGAFFVYTRFFAKRGGQTLGGSSGGGAGEAVSFVKDMVIIGGVWLIDAAQNVFNAVRSRRSRASTDYNYNYQPAPASPQHRQQSSGQPDYSSSAWQAPARWGPNPPAPPAKSPPPQAHNPLAGGGSLLEDDEDDEDEEAKLAMPGTRGANGRDGDLV